MAEAAEESQMPTTAVRIFVGGLGERVTEEELRSIFGSKNLGKVEGVDIVRTKGRSFAYCDFHPSSPAALSKIFSTYNGCVWKGGRLKLEKAKEHYLVRMRHEWEEDAALTSPHIGAVNADKVEEPKQKPKNSLNLDGQIRIFFPRLRKVKPLPLKGTGKHKYSFQRVEPLRYPKHFCDCEEHSGPSLPSREQRIPKPDSLSGGVDAEEIDLMRSVMNRLFKKEMGSETVQNEKKPAQKEVVLGTNLDEPLHEDSVEEDSEEDEDGLIINMVRSSGNTRKRMDKIDSKISIPKQQKTELVRDESSRDSLKVQKTNSLSTERSARASLDVNVVGEEPSSLTVHGEKKKQKDQLETRPRWSQKSSWRELVGDKTKSSFSVSHILTGAGSLMEEEMERDDEDYVMSDSVDSEDHESDEDSDVPNSMGSEDDELDKHSDESNSVDTEDRESDKPSDESNSVDSEDHESDKPSDESNSVDTEDHELDKRSDESISENTEDHESGKRSDKSNSEDTEDPELDKRSDESNSEPDKCSDESNSDDTEDHELDKHSDESASVDTEDHELDKRSDESNSMDTEDHESDKHSDELNPVDTEDHELDKSSDQSNSVDTEDHELDNHEISGGQTEEISEAKDSVIVELKESNAASSSKAGRGDSWLHKSSWTQLVADSQKQSFSLSRIWSSDMNEEIQDHNNDIASTDSKQVEYEPPNALVIGKAGVPSASTLGEEPKDCILQRSLDPSNGNSHKRKEKGVGTADQIPLGIGEECLFMRSSASLRGWANSKAALTGSRKRKKL